MTTETAGFLNFGDDDNEVMIPYPHTRIVERYHFHDRPGEDVLDLSRCYQTALDKLVEDGATHGWITG